MLVNDSGKGAAKANKSSDALATEALIDWKKRTAEGRGNAVVEIDEKDTAKDCKDMDDDDVTRTMEKREIMMATFKTMFCTAPIAARAKDRLSKARSQHGGEEEHWSSG